MKQLRFTLAALALSTLASTGFAGVVGKTMPKVELEGFAGTKATSYDDLLGRTVMLEFFAHWCGPCKSSVPHVNELHEQLSDKGLTILGVTGGAEGKAETENFASSTGMKYGYAYDKGDKLNAFFGITGIPHAAIIDPTGKIVWDGDPRSLDKAQIEKFLVGALPKPMWEWPASAAAARSALQKGKLADALAASAKITEADGGPAIKAALEAMIKGRVSGMQADLEVGNFLSAKNAATDLQKGLEGLPEKAEADKVLADIKANADADRIMKAQKTIRDVLGQRLGKTREMEKAITDLQKIEKDLDGTFAAKEANEGLKTLRKRKADKEAEK